jgi:hypothetical protein
MKIHLKSGNMPPNLYVSNTEGREELLGDEGLKKEKETIAGERKNNGRRR